ncbi:MAG: hypothetical protein V4690_02175 [Patescibacteria group bacterium]
MEQQPNIYALEHAEKGHSERKLNLLSDDTEDRQEALREARIALVENIKLKERFFEAISKRESMDASGFAAIENLFIKYGLSLSADEVEALVRQFNVSVSEYASKNIGVLSKNQLSPENLRERKMTSKGILSVLEFIKNRKKLLLSQPETKHEFYTEDVLDAKYKIDLIECDMQEVDGKLVVHTMNLIQVKSSQPTEDEIKNITNAHRSWIGSSVMDFDAFKREYTDGIPDEVMIEVLAKNSEEVENVLLEICTDPNGFNPDGFIKQLDLEDLNNKQKAWLMSDYVPLIVEHIKASVEKGTATQEEADAIINALNDIEAKVRSKAKLPRNIARINTVNSIIAVGGKIVHQTTLQEKPNDPNKAKILKYN